MFSWSKAKIFFYGNLIFLLGVALARFFVLENLYFSLLLLLVGGLLIAFWSDKTVRVALILAVFLLLGVWRYQVSLPVTNNSAQLNFYNGQPIKLAGVVCAEPDERIGQLKLTICSQELKKPETKKISGKVLVNLPLYPRYAYGDQVTLKC